MDFNFFDWIRQGVKKSVLLGVSDAVTQMGMPHTEEETKDKILSFLQTDQSRLASSTGKRRLNAATDGTPRKLGRSLSDLRTAADDAE